MADPYLIDNKAGNRPHKSWLKTKNAFLCEDVLELWGDPIVICTSLGTATLKELVNCKWLCSDGD